MQRALFSRTLCGLFAFGCLSSIAVAQTPALSFSDVPLTHSAFSAIEYLKQKNVLQGYADGTFKPDTVVNRAEAVKIIVSATVAKNLIDATKVETVYSDVPVDSWYAAYVEYARQTLGIIDGPPKKTAFLPVQPVKKAEFLKMLLTARGIDAAGNFGDLRGALSSDVASTDDWFFPYMRYALAASMTEATDAGQLLPARELTRGEIALLIFRLEMYEQARRTQALLNVTESNIGNVLKSLEMKDIRAALFASNRALLAARGALAAKPEEGLVKGAVKTAEGFQTLVRAYQAGVDGRLDDVLQLTSDTWHLAEKAKAFDVSLATLATQMQMIARNMADEARALLSQKTQ